MGRIQLEREIEKQENKKIKNATKVEIDGIKFKSKLEAYFYEKCKEADILAMYELRTFILLPGFTYEGKAYRPIKWTPDFHISRKYDDIFVEIKGYPNDAWPIKFKMAMYYLASLNQTSNQHKYSLKVLKNKKEIDNFIKGFVDEYKRVDGE